MLEIKQYDFTGGSTTNNINTQQKTIIKQRQQQSRRQLDRLAPRWAPKCSTFVNKAPKEKLNIVKQNNLCTNCLSSKHHIKSCKSESTCRLCNSRHHTQLHIHSSDNVIYKINKNIGQEVRKTHNIDNSPVINSQTNTTFCGIGSNTSKNILFAIAIIEIQNKSKHFQKVRVLLHSGSQANYITQKWIRKLNLNASNCSVLIESLGGITQISSQGVVTCTLKPLGNASPIFIIIAIVLSKICTYQPSTNIDFKNWSHIKNLKLAATHFYKPGSINLLLGTKIFSRILQNGRIAVQSNQPIAFNTQFGWILMGTFTTLQLT